MGIYKTHTTASEFTETASTNDMQLKFLDDGSAWARIHWLNVIKDATYFTDATEVTNCIAPNRFSKMGKVDNFATSLVTLTNLAPAIEGADSFVSSSYAASSTSRLYGNSSLQITGNTSYNETTINSTVKMPFVQGHVYYSRYRVYQSTLVGGCGFYWPVTAAGAHWNSSGLGTANTWVKKSVLKTNTTDASGDYVFRFDFDNAQASGTTLYDGLVVIDLTAAFGSGQEPTLAWCDANIPYFLGTKIIDAADTGYKRYEFMLTYPNLSTTLYNRWSQVGSPNDAAPEGYIPITTAWANHAGPIRKHGSSNIYDCDTAGSGTWFAPIGQTKAWTSTQAIPAADGSSQTETELWVRIDNLSSLNRALVYDGNHIAGGQFYEF